ncbi:hypothetical protein [Microbacterium sp.]|uniref:hypothetical protein n=1 Tax=Microbacterium sp. TaxID=51671 RepID=UPI0037361520
MGMWDEFDHDVARRLRSDEARRVYETPDDVEPLRLYDAHVAPLLVDVVRELTARGVSTSEVAGVAGWPLLGVGRGYSPSYFLAKSGELYLGSVSRSRGGARVTGLVERVREALPSNLATYSLKEWTFTDDGAVLHWRGLDGETIARDFKSYLHAQVVDLLVEIQRTAEVAPAVPDEVCMSDAANTEQAAPQARRRRWFGQ